MKPERGLFGFGSLFGSLVVLGMKPTCVSFIYLFVYFFYGSLFPTLFPPSQISCPFRCSNQLYKRK